MPVIIDEFEVIATPPQGTGARGEGTRGGASEANPPDARPAQLQHAIEAWQALADERALRVDDR